MISIRSRSGPGIVSSTFAARGQPMSSRGVRRSCVVPCPAAGASEDELVLPDLLRPLQREGRACAIAKQPLQPCAVAA